jgi:peptide chain release factor 2
LAARWCVFDLPSKEKEIAEIEKKSAGADFWSDQTAAQAIMRRLASLKQSVERWHGIEKEIISTFESFQLAEEDPSLFDDVQKEINELAQKYDVIELELAFSGEYDSRNALLSIRAGAGGTESQDWAEMLMRMYLRWASRRGFGTEILDESIGEEAGIKSTTIAIKGDYVFGYLRSEHGVHRLIRLSPFDTDHARHTSFVLVEIMPEADSDVEVNIRAEDLKIETFRSSGPGGQHMQKTSSAVRITHLPTGLTVSCQSERSQLLNKDYAMRILRSRLLEKELEKKAEENARIKGKRISAGWGNQIRSYVLHPYKMVKDHRTELQIGNAEAVLEGEIDDFINAYLRAGIGKE